MRVMITYYTGNEYKIADLHLDETDSIRPSQVADDCEDIISVIEVMPGVDYDKEGYQAASLRNNFVQMLIK